MQVFLPKNQVFLLFFHKIRISDLIRMVEKLTIFVFSKGPDDQNISASADHTDHAECNEKQDFGKDPDDDRKHS